MLLCSTKRTAIERKIVSDKRDQATTKPKGFLSSTMVIVLTGIIVGVTLAKVF